MRDAMDEFSLDGIEQTPTVQRDASLALFLGLYLLVLAFFVLLVTISTVEEVKSKAVMNSLSSTFSTLLPPTTDLQTFTAKEGNIMAGPQFQERMTRIFATAISVAKVEVVQPGRLMRITVPVDSLFEPQSTALRPSVLELLDRMVTTIGARPPGVRHDTEFVVGVAPDADGLLPLAQTLESARAGAFARTMVGRGVPPDSIVVGIKPGHTLQATNDAEIWFYVRDEEETRLRFVAPGLGE